MAENKFVLCFNALEKRIFAVDAVHLVDDPYRQNFYRFSLRLNFFEGDVDLDRTDDMRQLCLKKITNLMTAQKLWQNHHSFYVIQYEIRTITRKSNNLIQQNDNEGDENSSDEDDDSVSTFNTHESSSGDSAYSSPSDSDDESTAVNDSSGDSIHYWENENETLEGNWSFSDIEE